jgi:hypothetical protein
MRRWQASLAGLTAAAAIGSGVASTRGMAAPRTATLPYRVWWSFPNDDDTAIEVDDPDLSVSRWEGQRWKFAVEMQKCDQKKSKLLAQHKDGTPVREIRIDALEADGTVRATVRCVMTLKDWRVRIGKNLVYRLDDELDAHAAFLMPRRAPGMPAKMPLSPDGGAP